MSIGQLERSHATEPMHEINVTPLVDVMLVLLIIFIVTAPLLTHRVKLNLPKVTAQASSAQNPMVISVTRQEFLYLDDQPVSRAELGAALRAAVATSIAPTVELRADGELHHSTVVSLMAFIQQTGVSKLSILTSPAGVIEPVLPLPETLPTPGAPP